MAQESSISREKARAILASLGLGEEYDPAGDYYVRTGGVWEEELWRWGDGAPACVNHGTTSWLSPGCPPKD